MKKYILQGILPLLLTLLLLTACGTKTPDLIDAQNTTADTTHSQENTTKDIQTDASQELTAPSELKTNEKEITGNATQPQTEQEESVDGISDHTQESTATIEKETESTKEVGFGDSSSGDIWDGEEAPA